MISIHTPTKGVTCHSRFFVAKQNISIHTPTKGVTSPCYKFAYFSVISIHTPTKGVTSCAVCVAFKSFYFNPHSHEGSDCFCFFQCFNFRISIHTPTKGVTLQTHVHRLRFRISIHTPTKGVTVCPSDISTCKVYFNPHSHEGSDRVCWLF